MKLPTGKYQEGDITLGEQFTIEDAKERWVEQYEKRPGYPKQKMMNHLIAYKENVLCSHAVVYHDKTPQRHIFTTSSILSAAMTRPSRI